MTLNITDMRIALSALTAYLRLLEQDSSENMRPVPILQALSEVRDLQAHIGDMIDERDRSMAEAR